MSGIGPELPPHLVNRNKSAEPSSSPEPEGPAGPALPPHLQKDRSVSTSSTAGPSRSIPPGEQIEETEEVGPSLPPHILAARRAKAGGSTGPVSQSQGPVLPPSAAAGPSRSRPVGPTFLGNLSDSDDDDIGPRAYMAHTGDREGDGVREFLEREERLNKIREDAAKPKVLQREEWMLNPPEASDMLSKMDPTKLRSRGFSARTEEANTDMSAWTESPADKLERLKNGKRKAVVDAEEEANIRRKKQKDAEIRATIDQHNANHRVSSLMDQHAKTTSGKDKADAPVIWDRDSMLGVKGKLMEEKDRSSLVRDARALNDRFGHSKTGAFSQM